MWRQTRKLRLVTWQPPPYGRAATGYLPKEIYADCSHQWMYPVASVETARCQCHWCRCVGWWARNPSASNVNVSGGESTQLGHGETLTFWILFLNPSVLNYPPEGRTFLAQWGKFWTSCLYSGTRKNEPEIEIEMKFCRVLKILLDECQKKVAWSDPTCMKIYDTLIAVTSIGTRRL